MATAAAVGVAPFTGVTWPPPGQWLASAAPPELCRAGVHALLADSLATWTAEELWRVELDGAWELAPGIMVASRGRLLGRVEAWNDQTAREFARACATHVREHTSGRAAEYAADAATAAAEAVAGDPSFRNNEPDPLLAGAELPTFKFALEGSEGKVIGGSYGKEATRGRLHRRACRRGDGARRVRC